MTPSAARRARRWRRQGWQQRIGDSHNGAAIAEVWEGRHARTFVATAWRVYRGRNVFQRGRRYFKTEAAAKRHVERWLSTRGAAKPRKKPADGLASRPLKRGRK